MFLFYDFSHMKMFLMILVLNFLVRILNGIRGSWIQNYSRTAVAGSVKKKGDGSGICGILVRIRIRESVPLTNGS
jgi:hypothetical protein